MYDAGIEEGFGLRDTVYCVRGGMVAECQAAGHSVPSVREMNTIARFPLFPIFRHDGTPVDEMRPSPFRVGHLPQFYLSVNDLSVTPRGGPSR